MLTESQINEIASGISVTDVYEYIKNHTKEYQEFLKKEQTGLDDPYTNTINDIISCGKIEVPI